jgi:hypothetical protein
LNGKQHQSDSTPISGLPHSAISQWPISPDLASWKTADMLGSNSGSIFSSTNHRWSLCPQSSPLQSSDAFDMSCVSSPSSE